MRHHPIPAGCISRFSTKLTTYRKTTPEIFPLFRYSNRFIFPSDIPLFSKFKHKTSNNGRGNVPNDFKTIPNDFKTIPNDFKTIPNDFKTIPNDFKTIPNDFKTIPNDFKTIPNDFKTIPNDYKTIPNDYKTIPNKCGIASDLLKQAKSTLGKGAGMYGRAPRMMERVGGTSEKNRGVAEVPSGEDIPTARKTGGIAHDSGRNSLPPEVSGSQSGLSVQARDHLLPALETSEEPSGEEFPTAQEKSGNTALPAPVSVTEYFCRNFAAGFYTINRIMKSIIFSAGFIIGLALGFFPGIEKPKPLWWRLAVTGILSLMIFLALFPHTAGTFRDAVIVGRMDSTKSVPVLVQHILVSDNAHGMHLIQVKSENGHDISIIAKPEVGAKITVGTSAILNLRRVNADNLFYCEGIAAIQPTITLPYIIGLEERARILYFHVPMSWIATLAYIIAMIYGIKYLRNRDLTNDIRSSSAAALGTVFCLLATATGSIWAKFNWGSFWNWDPRETSIFVLLLVYAAYFVLRVSVEGEHQRAKLSSAYSILACVTVPFFVFIAPRLYEGLHPGSAGDVNAGPVISPQPDALNLLKQIILSLSFAGFTALFFWLLGLTVRIRRMVAARELAEE